MKTKHFGFVFVSLSTILLLNACKKNPNSDFNKSIESETTLNQSRLLSSDKITPMVNQAIVKSINVPINLEKNKSKVNNTTATCSDNVGDISLTYIGFKDEGPCQNGGRYITLRWILFYPDNNQGCNNPPGYGLAPVIGANSYATFNSTFLPSPLTAPLALSSVYYDLDAPVPPPFGCYSQKTVSATFLLTESQYGIINSFTFTMQLETDCPAFPLIQPVSAMTDNLTQNAYSQYPFPLIDNVSSGGLYKFRVWPVYSLCLPPHAPALGPSPDHKIKYRLYGSNSDWLFASFVTYQTSTTPFEVTVSQPGTYEFMYKYVQDASGNWSEYTPLAPVLVQ